MMRFALALSITALVAICPFAEAAERYKASYYYPLTLFAGEDELAGPWLAVDAVRKRVVMRGHRLYGFKPCESDSTVHCFSTTALSFAVPKAPIAIGDRWAAGGRDYVAVAESELELLGERIKLTIITGNDSSSGKRKVNYAYSPERGLVAIEIRSESGQEKKLLLLRDKHGFPFM